MERERLIKLGLWLLPVVVLVGLTWHHLAPSGERVVRLNVGGTSPYLQRFLPDERLSEIKTADGDRYQTVIDEPVYFTLTPPAGNFSQATVTLQFDPHETPLVELGALHDVAAQSFDFQPLANRLLENLPWTQHEVGNDLVLFSKDPRADITHFFSNPPDRSTVATYRTNFPAPFRLASYTPSGSRQEFDVSLRGPHELLTYVKNETFSFQATYSDINRTFGRDDGFIKVFNERGDLMLQEVITDDGNELDNQNSFFEKTLDLSADGWDEGVYRIVLSGTSDIVWRSVATTQRYLVVKNRVYLGDEVGYQSRPRPVTLYTDSKRLTFETQHVEGLQTLTVGGVLVPLTEVQAKTVHSISQPGVTEIYSPVADVKVTGEGKYAFSRSSYFNPDSVVLNAFTDIQSTGVDYVLAQLPPLRERQGWRSASATFDLTPLAMENGAYKFALSVPGVDAPGGAVDVHAITVRLSRPALTFDEFVADLRHLFRQLLP